MEISINQATRIINALKNGVVPDVDLEMLSVGRDKILTELQRCLDITGQGNGMVKFISGEYGSGKSFLLNIIKQKAVNQNFIVAKMQIEKGFRLHNFEDFYYHVMHNLSVHNTESKGTDFENIFDLWIKQLQSYSDNNTAAVEINKVISAISNYNSSFARALLTYIRAKINKFDELANATASWIKGEKNIPAVLKAKFEVKGNIDKQNSMDFLKAFIRLITLLGYHGLVILIDELELVVRERSDLRRNAYENLRYLVDASGAGEMNNCLLVFAGTDELFLNEEKGIKTYQALYQRIGNAINESSSFIDYRQPVIKLKKLNQNDLEQLTDKIISIHKILYNWNPDISIETLKNWSLKACQDFNGNLSELNLREYAKKVIEILDIMEQNPGFTMFKNELKLVKKDGTQVFVNTMLKASEFKATDEHGYKINTDEGR